MAKFFLQPGQRISRQKKPKDFRLIAFKSLLKIVKVFHTHETQRIIKKLKKIKQNTENTDCKQKQKQFIMKLEGLKAISTPILKQIVFYIMKAHLKLTNLDGLQQSVNLTPNQQIMKKCQEEGSLESKIIKNIAVSQTGKVQFQKVANLCDRIGKKKATKKEKSKERKQRKLQSRKNQPQQPGEDQNINSTLNNLNKNVQIQQQYTPENKSIPIKTNNFTEKYQRMQKKQQRTDFKKTGRNKVFHQKRMKKDYKVQEKPHIKTKPIQKQQKYQLHPSWQAKKQQQQQGFFNINQFKGKKILL